jgi:hypothetical protein
VVPAHQADTYSLKTFAQFDRWKDLSGDAKIQRIFEYLTDRRTGVYPMGVPAMEGPEELAELSAVSDPIKLLNVYPIGHCGTLGPMAAALFEGMGVGRARTLVLPGWRHVAAEVFCENRWHYVDLDVRAVFRRPEGSLASLSDAQREPALWDQPNSPRFFPLDNLGQVRRAYETTPVEHRYGWSPGGHTLDFVLRQGETFTRWWTPQGGRWNHHPSYGAAPSARKLLEQAPRGPKCKHESFTIHTHGNGRFVYRPDLSLNTSDFEDGVYDSHNVSAGPSGLTLRQPGRGHAIFEVRTPCVIVPLVGNLDNTADDCEASIVRLEASGARLGLSLDNGLSWRDLGPASGNTGEVDLTRHVAGTYGYLLKIELQGEPEKAVVRRLEITTWVQVHPASLPALRQGANRIRCVTGDHYGLATRVVAACPSAGKRDEFLRPLSEPPKDYDPARRTSRVRGSLVAKLPAPPGTKIAWFSAGASFATHQGSQARNTRNAIEYAADEPKGFKGIYRAEVPPDQAHWHYNVDREVRLEAPAHTVFVRYTGDPAVNNIRLYGHCVEDRSQAPAALHVRHTWTENGASKSKSVELAGPGEYEINTGAEPLNESIELSVPSQKAAAGSKPGKPASANEPSALGGPSVSIQPWFPKAPPLPPPTGEVIRVANPDELFAAALRVKPGGAILIADGHYLMPRYLEIRTDRVTLRSESGHRERVVLDGAQSRAGELIGFRHCAGVTVADLTLQNVRHNGVKLNSETGVQQFTLYNCVLHNLWQRAVKGVKVPADNRPALRPRDCRIQYCLFYNDRPKRFEDDPADTPQNFGGNYVGGIDVMYAQDWVISDNVFLGIQGRTRGARGAVFLWHESEGCVVERNLIIDCDVGIALGNSHRPAEVSLHCRNCTVRNNFVVRAPENGILADYTKDCRIVHNSLHDPTNRLGRLIRLVHDNDGLVVANNLLSGPGLRNESTSPITFQQNLARDLTGFFVDARAGNLRLRAPLHEIVGRAQSLPEVRDDIDRQPRGGQPDLGAHQFHQLGSPQR